MLLQIKLDRGLLMSVRVLKAENCLAYYVFETGARFPRLDYQPLFGKTDPGDGGNRA